MSDIRLKTLTPLDVALLRFPAPYFENRAPARFSKAHTGFEPVPPP